MKHILTVLSLISFSILINAQVVITNVTFPEEGDTLKTMLEIAPSDIIVTPSTGSIGALWDFTSLDGISQEKIYDDASEGASSSDFPDADLVVISLIGENYYTVNSTEVEYIGYIGPDPLGLDLNFPVHIGPTITEKKAPLHFSDNYSDFGSALIPISVAMIPTTVLEALPIVPDSFHLLIDIDRTSFVEGWGTLQIPNGTYSVLREKRVEKRETRLEARVTIDVLGTPFSTWQDITSVFPVGNLGQDTTTNYNFYGETSKELIANVSVSNNDLNNVLSVEYKLAFGDTIADTTTTPTPTPSSLNNIMNNNGLELFPNPVSNNLQFVFKDLKIGNYNVVFTNVVGEKIWEKKYFINSNKKISENVSEIPSGVYFYSLLDEKKQIIKYNRFIVK